jgi:KTSC domain
MGGTQTIDYDALAKEAGGTQAIDYDALAREHGGEVKEPDKPGIWDTIKSDVKGIFSPSGDMAVGNNPYPGMGQDEKAQAAADSHARDQSRKQAGYSLPYRAIAPVGESLGVNVSGMEDSAKEGNWRGVAGHALTAAGIAAAPLAAEGVWRGAGHIAETPVAGKVLGTAKVFGHAAEELPAVGSTIKAAKTLGQLKDVWAPGQKPVYPGAHLPAAPDVGVLHGPGAPPADLVQSTNLASAHTPVAAPAAQTGEALGGIRAPGAAPPVEPTSTAGFRDAMNQQAAVEPAQPQKVQPQKVEQLLNDSMGGKPLKPNVSLRDQLKPTAVAPDIPEGHTAVKDSSALKSYKYDPATKEFEAVTTGGQHYIHGDVSPEQAKAFEAADSKGKAWNELRKGSTRVGKEVNGQRVAARPALEMRSASPDIAAPGESEPPQPLPKSGAVPVDSPGTFFRSRDIGEKGIPYRRSTPAEATLSRADAERISPFRGETTGKPQEIVSGDLQDAPGFSVRPGPNGAQWVKMHGDVLENAIRSGELPSVAAPGEDLTETLRQSLSRAQASRKVRAK